MDAAPLVRASSPATIPEKMAVVAHPALQPLTLNESAPLPSYPTARELVRRRDISRLQTKFLSGSFFVAILQLLGIKAGQQSSLGNCTARQIAQLQPQPLDEMRWGFFILTRMVAPLNKLNVGGVSLHRYKNPRSVPPHSYRINTPTASLLFRTGPLRVEF
jgi:hypothetical protein